MRILIYGAESRPAATLHGRLRHLLPAAEMVFLSTLVQLTHQLLLAHQERLLVVLLIGSSYELELLESIRSLLDQLPVLLSLPTDQEELVSQGYRLQPRFLTVGEEAVEELAAVVEKISQSWPEESDGGCLFSSKA